MSFFSCGFLSCLREFVGRTVVGFLIHTRFRQWGSKEVRVIGCG